MMPRVDGRPAPLPLPGDLSPDAAQVWREITKTTQPEHFRPSDVPLLKSYCEACAMADRAAAELAENGAVIDGKASPWLTVQEKSVRAQTSLSLRLRLCPSARTDPKSAGRERVPSSNPPLWKRT
jgi:phage terminase small subunit